MASKTVRIGAGSASNHDRIEPAADLANSGLVDYLSFDCLSERTLADAQIRKWADARSGQDLRIPRFMDALAPFLARGGTVIGNFGAANIEAGAAQVIEGLRRNGVKGVKVGIIRGDDVLAQIRKMDVTLPERGCTVGQLKEKIITANAYIGAEPICELLQKGAKFILGGRIADPSLFVAPICHELGWALDDWDRLAHATLAGHLLECTVHVTGSNWIDPPYRVLEGGLDNLGFPFANVTREDIFLTKLKGTGGGINRDIARSQLAYEVHDPARYLTPDVTADFSQVRISPAGKDRVSLKGATGRPRPDMLKVMVGLDLGWKAVGEISFGASGCVEKAKICQDIMMKRLEPLASQIDEIMYHCHGLDAIHEGRHMTGGYPPEVRFRVAARCKTKECADILLDMVEYLYHGPAGAAGASKNLSKAIGLTPAFIPRSKVALECELVGA